MKTKAQALVAIFAALLLLTSCHSGQTLRLLVGTYTEGNASEGVYLYEFNTGSCEAKLLDTVPAGNPSFVAASPDRNFAYAVSEYGDGRQGVYSFRLAESSLDSLNFSGGAGADPCNILLAGGYIFTADYSGGSMSVYPLNADGTVGEIAAQFAPDCSDGRVSHIHCAALSPDGKYVFITDLGRDAIHRVTLAEDGGVPEDFTTVFEFDPEKHPGPRHFIFSQDGRYAFLIGETGDYLSTFRYRKGGLKHISTQKAYAGEGLGSADIHLSPDGRFLYTSHRLREDGVSIFKVRGGKAENVGYCYTGIHPRNFTITPDGKLLLCACRDSGRIEIYKIDKKTGLLSATGKSITLPAPVCIQIL